MQTTPSYIKLQTRYFLSTCMYKRTFLKQKNHNFSWLYSYFGPLCTHSFSEPSNYQNTFCSLGTQNSTKFKFCFSIYTIPCLIFSLYSILQWISLLSQKSSSLTPSSMHVVVHQKMTFRKELLHSVSFNKAAMSNEWIYYCVDFMQGSWK